MTPFLTSTNFPQVAHDTTYLTRVYAGKKILVTGGAGFIGSHLVDRLVSLGALVTVLDNLSSGSRTNLESVKHAITFVEGTITDPLTCLDAAFGAAYLFHLAAMVSVPESIDNPALCYDVNTSGLVNVLEAARRQFVPTVFFASSSAVYGNQSAPCTEETHGTPNSPYGCSKLIGELLCQQYAHNYGLATVCGRYFNVHGPRQSAQGAYAGVIARFKQSLANNQSITLFGNGNQRRDFIDVACVVEASLTLAALPASHIAGQSVNIASGTSTSILELFNQLRLEYPQYDQEPLFAPARAGDIAFSQADCSKYERLSVLARTIL